MNFTLPTKSFKVSHLQQLYDTCYILEQKETKENDDEQLGYKKLQRIYKPITDYVYLYYYETQKSKYYFYNVKEDKFEQRDKNDFVSEVMVKINEKLFKKLFEKNSQIFSIISKIDKPRVYKEEEKEGDTIQYNYYINECKGFLHMNYKPYDEYSTSMKKRVNIMLEMIKEISCGNNETFYEAYIKYLSQLCRGMKTQVIIYKKTLEGCGKSTESDF